MRVMLNRFFRLAIFFCVFSPSVSFTADTASLQRGAKFFMNYCSGCHSLKYLRYRHLARGLDLKTFDGRIDKELLFNNLVFQDVKLDSFIQTALSEVDAITWFGKVPPDLTLIAKVRGMSWLYRFLNDFSFDKSKPFNSNNLLYPDVRMPNVLGQLQGKRLPIYQKQTVTINGQKQSLTVISGLKPVSPGEMSEQSFKEMTQDIVNFLSFVAEPEKSDRQYLGSWAVFFMIIFAALAYALNKCYWKQIKK